MLKRALNQFRWHTLLVPLFVLSAILQPSHSIVHDLSVESAHSGAAVLALNDPSSIARFSQHREEHGTELCGQCQFGFMGDGVQNVDLAPPVHSPETHAISAHQRPIAAEWRVTRNRGPPLS